MAEILGVVAGGAGLASLAIQLGENAHKLKKFYHNYKGAPEFLENVSFELETFALTLTRLERDRQSFDLLDDRIVDRCIQICRRACNEVQSAIDRLEAAAVKSARKGKLMAAMDRSSMMERRRELDSARNSLAFAYQLYRE